MATLLDRPFTVEEAHEATSWSYPPPFDDYNLDASAAALFLDRSREGHGYYPAVDTEGALVGFAVFGLEARVRGQQVVEGTLDVGAGVRPEVTSRGVGTELLGQLIDFGRGRWAPTTFRVAVAQSNVRSLALCARAGFTAVGELEGPGGRPFVELTLPMW